MKATFFLLPLFLCMGLMTETSAQTGRPNPEKVWKDISRLPENLRDDIKKNSWWKNAATYRATGIRLDSTIKFTSFNGTDVYPLNKSKLEYPATTKIVQSDFVNYGVWVPQKRYTLSLDAQKRVVEVLEEEPEPGTGAFLPAAKTNLYWHGKSDVQLDSVVGGAWDDQWQQWIPAFRLYSSYDAEGHETATETYRYAEGIQLAGIREEYQLDAEGNPATTQQFLAKDGKWTPLGKVTSGFDKQHHETTRQEDILLDADKTAPVRKLKRTYDAQGRLTLEERFKWNEPSREWAPLKTLSAGYDAKKHSEWLMTESFKANSNFKGRVEVFHRAKDGNPEKELHSSFLPETGVWQVVSDTQYYYSK
jgi:hypothetical protein